MAYTQSFGRGPMQKTGRSIPSVLTQDSKQEGSSSPVSSPEVEAYLSSPRGRLRANQSAASTRPQGTMSQTPEDNSDGFFQQAGTLLSNPLDGAAALGNQARGNVRKLFNLSDEGDLDGVRGNLTNLRRARLSGDKGAQKVLDRSSGLNLATQIGMLGSGTALGAQTINDLVQGDATGAIIKKAKVLKPIYNAVKKLGVDPTKLTKQAYKAYKTNKNVF